MDIKRTLLVKFKNMYDSGEIDKTTYEFLKGSPNEVPRLGRLFLLPKIHKLNDNVLNGLRNEGHFPADNYPPCRPIISQCKSVTEGISQFIDYFLIPIVKRQSSFIRDSGDFINKIESLHPKKDCLLVTFDCTSMYTNMEFEEFVLSVGRAYENALAEDYKIKLPDKEIIVSLLSLLLNSNYFEFNKRYFQQQIGVSMGSKCSPSICDIRAYEVINDILNKFKFKNDIVFFGRFRDDAVLVFHSSRDRVIEFFKIANAHHPLLKFTFDISDSEMTFLDTTVYKGVRFDNIGILDIRSHFKSTNTYQYLHRTSLHDPKVFAGFIKGETIRHRRNNSDAENLEKTINNFKIQLLERGYAENEIDQGVQSALRNERSELLRFNQTVDRPIPLVFVTEFHFNTRNLRKNLCKRLLT